MAFRRLALPLRNSLGLSRVSPVLVGRPPEWSILTLVLVLSTLCTPESPVIKQRCLSLWIGPHAPYVHQRLRRAASEDSGESFGLKNFYQVLLPIDHLCRKLVVVFPWVVE